MRKINADFVAYAAWSTALLCIAYAVLWAFGFFSGLGFHGSIAAVLGITLTSILAVLLMGLLFFSEHSGHDEEVHDATRNDRGHN